MLDYVRERAIEALGSPRKAVLATSGPAGLQAGEFPCQAAGAELFLLVPRTSDHLYNLEHDPAVTLLTDRWELKGTARLDAAPPPGPALDLLAERCAEWCALVQVIPERIQVRRERGWGYIETIELDSAR